jgi:NAD(P)-dependent dehydrogenase (short-subunit alcohol dehydrogenase family)
VYATTIPPFKRKSKGTVLTPTAAFPGTCVYGATKAAMEYYAQQWALEFGHQFMLTANTVNPGPVATDMYLK